MVARVLCVLPALPILIHFLLPDPFFPPFSIITVILIPHLRASPTVTFISTFMSNLKFIAENALKK
ncbi:hypothetical protein J3Q64DRAFT_1733536 [Phycomyces blakesleeanus]|uniref:Uncharacterized protein n=1 Tax=Phycomyces blakesleeanus TaxID=4837 RepID=A0ABR3B304_PHYBL